MFNFHYHNYLFTTGKYTSIQNFFKKYMYIYNFIKRKNKCIRVGEIFTVISFGTTNKLGEAPCVIVIVPQLCGFEWITGNVRKSNRYNLFP